MPQERRRRRPPAQTTNAQPRRRRERRRRACANDPRADGAGRPTGGSAAAARWPIWTTCANVSTAKSPGSVRPSGPTVAARWLNCRGQPGPRPGARRAGRATPSSTACGPYGMKPSASSPSWASPATRTSVAVRPGPARSPQRPTRRGAPPGTVLAVIRPGYGSAQNILRPAGVVVSRGPDAADPD